MTNYTLLLYHGRVGVSEGREGQGTPVKTDQYDLAIMPFRIMFAVILQNLLIS